MSRRSHATAEASQRRLVGLLSAFELVTAQSRLVTPFVTAFLRKNTGKMGFVTTSRLQQGVKPGVSPLPRSCPPIHLSIPTIRTIPQSTALIRSSPHLSTPHIFSTPGGRAESAKIQFASHSFPPPKSESIREIRITSFSLTTARPSACPLQFTTSNCPRSKPFPLQAGLCYSKGATPNL